MSRCRSILWAHQRNKTSTTINFDSGIYNLTSYNIEITFILFIIYYKLFMYMNIGEKFISELITTYRLN